MNKDLSQFEKIIGITFDTKELLQRALTHRSYLNEHPEETGNHNERLEFLGDAVLELAVTDYLFSHYPDRPEGELTAIRAALVNTISIARVADELNADNFLRLSKGEAKDTGRGRQFILANTYEAIIGAVYLDRGYDVAADFIARTLLINTKNVVENETWRDPKSVFQEEAQRQVGVTPTYNTLSEAGPDHDKEFTVGVFIGEEKIAEGVGKSKQEAESVAAENGLAEKGWM